MADKVKNMPCGCKVALDYDGSLGLLYCPKHAAAPDMYEALKAQHDAIDILFAMLIGRDNSFFPSKSGQPWEALLQGNKALAKAKPDEWVNQCGKL